MRGLVLQAIDRSGLASAWRLLNSSGFIALTYHGFRRRASSGLSAHEHMRLDVSLFRLHLEHLVSRYRVVTLAEAVAHVTRGSPLPSHAVVITFDDGYRSCYELAFPLLEQFRVPATLFVATDFVFEKKPLWHDRVEYAFDKARGGRLELQVGTELLRLDPASHATKLASLRSVYRALKVIDQAERDGVIETIEQWAGETLTLSENDHEAYAPVEVSELVQMSTSGLVEVGCHTKTHAILSRCQPRQLDSEVAVSKRVLEDCLGRKCDFFCYPNGTSRDFNVDTRLALARAGFESALTTVPGRNHVGADPMELNRVTAPAALTEFKLAASGLRTDLGRAYRSISGVFRSSQPEPGGM
jgi:peptidoglycan/xylan/chitin deacetylase (PgdA/CDA1 family)